mmetsp:Transcript_34297/g.78217  ORF Transcript_34297/g.78217 Transcript_34297/m.78217 type:complete len:303 (-) Transcript_34297:708-1616(-)
MGARIYVGNLPMDIRTRDVEDLFYKYGKIRDIDLKTPSRPPAFCFVTFEQMRDAEEACRGRDGVAFEGTRLRCEISRGTQNAYGGGGGGGGGASGGGAAPGPVGEVEGGLKLSSCDGTCCRLDIFHDGAFGSICDDSVTQDTAEVACAQLGFATAGASVQVGGSGYGSSGTTPGTGAIWLDELSCAGTEATIFDCPHNDWGNHNCIHAEDLGLCCPGGGDGGTGGGSGGAAAAAGGGGGGGGRRRRRRFAVRRRFGVRDQARQDPRVAAPQSRKLCEDGDLGLGWVFLAAAERLIRRALVGS